MGLKIKPINSLLVKVEKEDLHKQLPSGIFVVENEQKGTNKGIVVEKPFLLTQGFEEYKPLVDAVEVGDEVVFNSKMSYPVLSLSHNEVYMLVGLESIQAILPKE